MSVQNNTAGGESVVLERPAVGGVKGALSGVSRMRLVRSPRGSPLVVRL